MEDRKAGFINGTKLHFSDLSDELFRVYVFPDMEIRIEKPLRLNVTKKEGGDSHRVYDENGVSHYIPQGWRHLYWMVKPGQSSFKF